MLCIFFTLIDYGMSRVPKPKALTLSEAVLQRPFVPLMGDSEIIFTELLPKHKSSELNNLQLETNSRCV